MSLHGEFYTVIDATENEHFCLEHFFLDFCQKNQATLLYYRKMKNGHIPMKREVKIKGSNSLVRTLYSFTEQTKLLEFVEGSIDSGEQSHTPEKCIR